MFTLVFLILANFAIGGHGSIQFQEPKLERFVLASTHGVFEMLDPKTAKNRRYLVKHLFGGNESQYTEWLGLYDQAIEHGSKIPYDVAMIKFREKYVQSGKYWSKRIHEELEEGGQGSGNFGHAGRAGEVGGSSGVGGVTVFHGTVSTHLDSILSKGITSSFRDVYVTTKKETALMFAKKRSEKDYPGSTVVVIHVRIPKNIQLRAVRGAWREDPLEHGKATSFRLIDRKEGILPEWITGYTVVNKDGTESYTKLRESYEPQLGGLIYVPIIFVPKALSETGSAKSGNYGHAGRVGKRGGSKAGTGGAGGKVLDTGEIDLNDVPGGLAKIYVNWKQDNAEKMVLIGKDGKIIVVGTGDKGQVNISMKEIQKVLKDNGQDFSTLKYVVHNHNNGESASQADVTAFKAFMAAGFGGDYQTYTPATGQIRNVPYSLGHESLRKIAHEMVSSAVHTLALDDTALRVLVEQFLKEGGPGSGNFGHAGRAGEVGGSGEGGGEMATQSGPIQPSNEWAMKVITFGRQPTEADKSASLEYAGSSYQFINNLLRDIPYNGRNEPTGKSDWSEKTFRPVINTLDSLMKNSHVNRDIEVYRIIHVGNLRGHEVGDEFVEKGFASTSARKDICEKWRQSYSEPKEAYLTTIRVPKGTSAISMQGVRGVRSNAAEITLDRGLRFRIESINKKDKSAILLVVGHD